MPVRMIYGVPEVIELKIPWMFSLYLCCANHFVTIVIVPVSLRSTKIDARNHHVDIVIDFIPNILRRYIEYGNPFNISRPGQNSGNIAYIICKCISLIGNLCILTQISLHFVSAQFTLDHNGLVPNSRHDITYAKADPDQRRRISRLQWGTNRDYITQSHN